MSTINKPTTIAIVNSNIPFTINGFINNLWNTTYIIHALILCFVSGLFMELLKFPIFSILFFVSGFSVFDVIGYNIAVGDINDNTNIAKYRITQVMIQVFMLLIVLNSTGFLTVLGCLLLWWLTTCDRLYYLILKTPQQSTDTYPWLENWSVFYFLKNIFKIEATAKTFNTLSVLGLLFGIIISYLN